MLFRDHEPLGLGLSCARVPPVRLMDDRAHNETAALITSRTRGRASLHIRSRRLGLRALRGLDGPVDVAVDSVPPDPIDDPVRRQHS